MNKSFSGRLSELRKERGLSQKEAAVQLGVSQALLSHYEKGIRECGLDFVVKVSEFYGVTCDYLLGRSDSRMGFNGELGSNDIPEDDIMDFHTLIRAASNVLEAANRDGGKEYRDIVGRIYVLIVYRLLLSCRDCGRVPDELFTIPSEPGKYATSIMSYKLESLFSSLKGIDKDKSEDVPKSVETVINFAETYIRDNIKDVISF